MKANENRRSRFAFGLNPSGYDRARMPFSAWIVNWALARTGFRSGCRVLEVGAGSGQLTGGLLRARAKVTALEPSDGLAELLLEKYSGRDGGTLEVSRVTFERFATSKTFALVAAANSFHWIDPDVSYRKAADVLDPQGRLCLFWYFPILADSGYQQLVNTVVRDYGLDDLVREPAGYDDALQQVLADGRNEVNESGYLRCLDWVLKPQSLCYPVATYCDLLATYASSKNLADLQRSLFSSVFRDTPSVELVVYEYACVAAPIRAEDR